MAFRHGKNAALTINAVALAAFLNSEELSIDVDTADTSMFGSTWKSALAGLIGATLDFAGAYDPTATTAPSAAIQACITGGVPVTVLHYPGGIASGQRLNTFSALVTNFKEGSTVGDKVTISGSLLVTGAITPTVQ